VSDTADWRAGYRSLEGRVRSLPAELRAGLSRMQSGVQLPTEARRFVLTGVGSSAAHAHFLAHLLREGGTEARVVPLSWFASASTASFHDDVLVVISQGVSPNARVALRDAAAWRHVLLLTAAGDERFYEAAVPAGVAVCPFPAGQDEYLTLVRVVGPMAGYLTALHVAGSRAPAWRIDDICDTLRAAPPRAAGLLAELDVTRLRSGIAFLTSGTYGELTHNLRCKVLEGMLLPAPPVWDLLEVAHGPLQQAHRGALTFIALTRRDAAPLEADVLARLEGALDGERHTILRLDATLPGPLAIFEHEALMNELMLRYIAASEIDQIDWPGRGRDRELYEIDRIATTPTAAAHVAVPSPHLAALTWPELEAKMAKGALTAVVPLGSTEQHGPHLPYATDTWIAEALAARLCARLGDAIACPTIPIGCSSEHLEFPGTLDVRAETLHALLLDVVRSLRRHGFERIFLFSAHGGNFTALAAALPALRAAGAPMRVSAYVDLEELTARLHRSSAAFGVSPEASGHHAGELETSILRGLRPEAVRVDRLAPGHRAPGAEAHGLFYPSLRPHAPSGVVGDPSDASATRAGRYLDDWVELLFAAYRRENASA
jgi:creatinine amidohydrolase